MKVFWHNDTLLHDPPHEILSGRLVPYLESPERLLRIRRTLEDRGIFEIVAIKDDWSSQEIHELILAVHSADYVDYLKTIYDDWVAIGGDKTAVFPETFRHGSMQPFNISAPKDLSPLAKPGKLNHLSIPVRTNLPHAPTLAHDSSGLYCFDLSCPITSGQLETFKAAIASVKVSLSAARFLLQSIKDAPVHLGVFALGRPPGHHAQDALCGGYCFLNNAAIAAKYLLDHGGMRNVAILDVDYHHGNGTQQIFYGDQHVLYVSLHAAGDYPYFTGSASERGTGSGFGFNHNFPLPLGTADDEYIHTLEEAVNVIKDSPDVDCVIVSLGVDTYSEDPICQFALTQDCYPRIGKAVAGLGKPTLFIMEGGYHLDTLGENVCGVLLGFASAAGFKTDQSSVVPEPPSTAAV